MFFVVCFGLVRKLKENRREEKNKGIRGMRGMRG